MQLECNHCQAALDLPKKPLIFACAACGTVQKLVQTDSAFYIETIENNEFDLAAAHIEEAKRQRKEFVINALLELDSIWKLREVSFMENGKLRITDKNIKSSSRIFMILALGATVFAFGYQGRSLLEVQNLQFISLAAMLIFWTLALWQSIVNSEKEQAYKEAKSQFDAQRQQLEAALQQLNNLK
jgi:hypothetical protein